MNGQIADNEGYYTFPKQKYSGKGKYPGGKFIKGNSGVAGFDINCKCSQYEKIKEIPEKISKKEKMPDVSFNNWKKQNKL